ncbi:MAG: VWA domain-containing protein [Clostridiales bacterium]|nr:VWA domain-containing protein [Clostridiales bacterium]
MADSGVYLEKLSSFSKLLRQEGLSVSPRETEDASRILISLGFEDKEQVKTALRTVYAKSREEQLIFDKLFDGFFVSEEVMRKQVEEQLKREAELQKNLQNDQEELQINGKPIELSEEQRIVYAGMDEDEREKLKQFMDKYKDSAQRHPQLYDGFIHSVFMRSILEQQMMAEDAAVGIEESDPELGLLYRDISKFKDIEIPKAISIIQSISQQINRELAAKHKRTGHSSALDFRRTFRKGRETGGSFYRLKYKKKPSRRKQLVLLCDVSWSMMQFSEFALRFIQQLNHVSESSRVFLFSEEIHEADAFSLQNMDLFRNYVKECGVYGKGTDLGMALDTLNTMHPPALNAATTLLILSDTKTVNQPRAMDALQEAKRQAGRVIWLNPIPERKWKYIRSVQAMASICTMVSCSTLSTLAAACKRLAQ